MGMKRNMNVLRDSRKSALMTQKQMAKRLGCSLPTIVSQEKAPEEQSLSVLQKWYDNVGTDGRVWIREFVGTFFMD